MSVNQYIRQLFGIWCRNKSALTQHDLAQLFSQATTRALMGSSNAYPSAHDLSQEGIHAYCINALLRTGDDQKVLAALAAHGFTGLQFEADGWQVRHNEQGDTLTCLSCAEFAGLNLTLITNCIELLRALQASSLQPPTPSESFPDCDPGTFGSLQGSMDYWWSYCWLPFWNNLIEQEQTNYLTRHSVSEGWQEFIELHAPRR